MNSTQMRLAQKNVQAGIMMNMKDALIAADTYTELQDLAEICFEYDEHYRYGKLIAQRAQSLDIDELSVGEYDKDRVLLKIEEVPEEDDYYGFADVDIGEWVSSAY